jgi:hypothetical protein
MQREAGFSSDYITIEEIRDGYYPVSVPMSILWYRAPDIFRGFDNDLALTIVSFLSDRDAHPNLYGITLLGDAPIIPRLYMHSLNRNKLG